MRVTDQAHHSSKYMARSSHQCSLINEEDREHIDTESSVEIVKW